MNEPRTIRKVVFYESRERSTGDFVFDSEKIKLVFSDGTVKTFYKAIDKAYNLIEHIAIDTIMTHSFEATMHNRAPRPYTKVIIKGV